MEKIRCDARGRKIFFFECKPNDEHSACQNCTQPQISIKNIKQKSNLASAVRKAAVKPPRPKATSKPVNGIACPSVVQKKARKRGTIPKRTSPEVIEAKRALKENMKKLEALCAQISSDPEMPMSQLEPQEVERLHEEYIKMHRERDHLSTLLTEERIRLKGWDYYKLVAKVKSHWDYRRPFNTPPNAILRKLLEMEPSLQKEPWFRQQIDLEILRGHKVTLRPDVGSNDGLFAFVETTLVEQDLTFMEMFALIQQEFYNSEDKEDERFADNYSIRKLLTAWGFSFVAAKRGRPPKKP